VRAVNEAQSLREEFWVRIMNWSQQRRLPKRNPKNTKKSEREKKVFHGGSDQTCPKPLLGQMAQIQQIHSMSSLNSNNNNILLLLSYLSLTIIKISTSTHHPA